MTLIKWNKPTGNAFESSVAFPTVANLINDVLRNDFFSDRAEGFLPAVNISETNDSYVVELSVPGFAKEDFKVKVNDNLLTISAEHKTETTKQDTNYTRKEFSYGSFERSFTLPDTANAESIEGKYEAGILKLIVAKKEDSKVKPIKEIKIS